MSKWMFTITVDVDDDALDASEPTEPPYLQQPDEWDASDLRAAADLGIVDLDEAEIAAVEV